MFTNHKPACVILTLFQFSYNSKLFIEISCNLNTLNLNLQCKSNEWDRHFDVGGVKGVKYCTVLWTIDQRLCMLKVSQEAQNTL